LSYEAIVRDQESLQNFPVDLLRIDSPGENDQVAHALIALGGGPANATLERGEINFLREYHQGFCKILDLIDQTGIPCLNSPSDIAAMFDKWACHLRFQEHGIARPPSEPAPANLASMLGKMRERGNGRVFLKPLHGSSASGVCALQWTRDRQQLTAPLRILSGSGKPCLVNSLDVSTYADPADIQVILELLLPQRMIMEEWVPKLTMPGGAVDLRVLVIAGEARHWVVRQSRHPMTNLHLGNQRGDPAALEKIIGSPALEAAFELAVQAAGCFPDSLYAGVDILIDSRHRPLVGEINAFGDLLPRVLHRGESAYTAIATACHAQRCLI
jgi:glutathione synthase/RimK-type ligase-like ATP-grasp enzyme